MNCLNSSNGGLEFDLHRLVMSVCESIYRNRTLSSNYCAEPSLCPEDRSPHAHADDFVDIESFVRWTDKNSSVLGAHDPVGLRIVEDVPKVGQTEKDAIYYGIVPVGFLSTYRCVTESDVPLVQEAGSDLTSKPQFVRVNKGYDSVPEPTRKVIRKLEGVIQESQHGTFHVLMDFEMICLGLCGDDPVGIRELEFPKLKIGQLKRHRASRPSLTATRNEAEKPVPSNPFRELQLWTVRACRIRWGLHVGSRRRFRALWLRYAATPPAVPCPRTRNEGNAVGIAVSNPTNSPFATASPRSSCGEPRCWKRTTATAKTMATGMETTHPVPKVVTAAPKSIQSTAMTTNAGTG